MTRMQIGRSGPADVPACIGPYKFENVIGAGSFSLVLRATHSETEQVFAIKLVSKQFLIANKIIDLFQREIKLFAAMSHKNVVKFYELLDDAELIYVVMEHCGHGDLNAYVGQHGAFGENGARPLVSQIVCGLEYMHRNGVAHRDLKPENILIDADFNCKLADFGFARPKQQGNLMATQCGSPAFTAPEIISGVPYDGISSDMWSLGVSIFFIVLGKVPWEQTGNEARMFYDIQTARYHVPDTLTREFSDLVRGMMHPQPMMRFTIEQAVTHPWFGCGPSDSPNRWRGSIERTTLPVMLGERRDVPMSRRPLRQRSLVFARTMPETTRLSHDHSIPGFSP